MAEHFSTRHRGPYVLLVGRPHPNAKKAERGFSTSEWLPGAVEPEECEAEARALMDDPRDTIDLVHVFSVGEGCFVHGYRKTP